MDLLCYLKLKAETVISFWLLFYLNLCQDLKGENNFKVLLYNSFFKANSSRIVASAHFLLGKILSVEGQLTLAICIVNWWFSTHSYKLLMMPKILFEQNHKKAKEQLRFSSFGRSNWQKNLWQKPHNTWTEGKLSLEGS